MKLQKGIVHFVICLTSLYVWDLMFSAFKIIPGNVYSALFLISLFYGIYCIANYINDFYFENLYFKCLFSLLIAYHISIFIRGIPTNYNAVKTDLQVGYLFWPLVIPLFVFFEKKIDILAQLLKMMYYLCIAFFFILLIKPGLIINRVTAENFIHPFGFGAGFLLMNTKYLSKWKALICLLVCMVALLSFTYLARRNAIVTFSGFLFTSVFLYFKETSAARLVKFFPLGVLFLLLAVAFTGKIPDSLTSNLAERALDDTRTGVFDTFFKGMQGHWVFGKGMNGTYYSPIEETVLDDGATFGAVENRDIIETGYLQIMLNGGLVELVLYLLVLIPAALLGIFNSSNAFTRSCGFLILLWLVDMAVFGVPTLYLQYIFIWISVGICYKKSFRQMPEEAIYTAFENYKLA